MADPAPESRTPFPKWPIRPESMVMVLLLTVLVAYGAISNNIVLPILPALASEFQVPVGTAMLTISVFFVGFGVGQAFYGSLSDRFGRRPVLMAGVGLYTLGSLGCALAPDMETLMVARLLQGLAAASAQVLARAVVRDLFTPIRAAQVLSLMSAAFAFASAFAPLAGGVFLGWFGWQAVFIALASVGAATFLTLWLGFGESLAARDEAAMDLGRLAVNYRALAVNRIFLGYTFTFSAAFAGMFAFHSGSSFVFITLFDYTPQMFGLFFALVLVGYLIGTVASSKLVAVFGIHRLVAAGVAASILASGIMVALVASGLAGPSAILISQFFFMFGFGLIMPNAIAGALAPFPEKAGAASALLGFIQQSSGGSMVAVLGLLVDGTALPMAGCIFGGALLSVLCFATILPRNARVGETAG
ncbi:MAG TPA: multidrug effflux MFS transporter [Alphaproteobacteria bacterium]|nr:multidrug effflux MFS transporter [Alphaproteobacteria bacterium]